MQAKIEAFLSSGGAEGSFEALALDVFAYQYETVPAYRRLCTLRGVTPARVAAWQEIPTAPVDLFKEDLAEPTRRTHVFFSSGTTGGETRRSKHALSSLDTYRLSAVVQFETMVLGDAPGPMAVLVLAPSAETHPTSSLGQMFSWIVERCSNGNVCHAFEANGTVAVDRALEWLADASAGRAPVLVLAVSSALTAVLAELRRHDRALRLPADSRIVDTGGNKAYAPASARAHTYSARALLKAAWTWLHVPGYLCLNEYGMTEMLSQFYDDALVSRVRGELLPRSKVGPPWARTSIVDPTTLEPVPRGERGLLRHVDLANWESVSFLQTHDVGRAAGNGFEVLGRAVGAEVRGCSSLARTSSGPAATEQEP